MSVPAAMTEVSTWYLLYASAGCAPSAHPAGSYSLWMWMTLGVVGFKLCTNAIQFYNFCVAWNLISQTHRVDLQVLHFSKKNFMSRKIQIEDALDTIMFGEVGRPTTLTADETARCDLRDDKPRATWSSPEEDACSTTKTRVASSENDSISLDIICQVGKGGEEANLSRQGNVEADCESKNVKTAKEHFHTASSCPICLADFQPRERISSCKESLSCKHVFHTECLQMWLFKNESCPICRFKIVPPPSLPHYPVAFIAVPSPGGPAPTFP